MTTVNSETLTQYGMKALLRKPKPMKGSAE
jgi:hypothetical protein